MWLPAVSLVVIIRLVPQDMKEQPTSETGEGYTDDTGVTGGHNDVLASTSTIIEGHNAVIPSTSINTGSNKDNIITSATVQQSKSVSDLDINL